MKGKEFWGKKLSKYLKIRSLPIQGRNQRLSHTYVSPGIWLEVQHCSDPLARFKAQYQDLNFKMVSILDIITLLQW